MNPEALVGGWRRFGPIGPVYEIIGVGEKTSDGDRLMKVKVLESGEVAEYKLLHLLEDPVEA